MSYAEQCAPCPPAPRPRLSRLGFSRPRSRQGTRSRNRLPCWSTNPVLLNPRKSWRVFPSRDPEDRDRASAHYSSKLQCHHWIGKIKGEGRGLKLCPWKNVDRRKVEFLLASECAELATTPHASESSLLSSVKICAPYGNQTRRPRDPIWQLEAVYTSR